MLTITVTWVGPTYEAALDDGPEWPPHPARMFCALVSAAGDENGYDDALRWLEAQPLPAVYASVATSSTLASYVPVNRVAAEKATVDLPARTAGLRRWHRSHPRSPTVHFVWDASSPATHLAGLAALARRVPFLGRSTSSAVVTVAAGAPADVEGLQRHEATLKGRRRLRVPYAGYLDALRAAFDDDDPASTANRWAPYGQPATETPTPETAPGPWPDLVTLGFEPGAGLDGRLVVRVASAFKQAVLGRLGTDRQDEDDRDPGGPARHDRSDLALLHGHHDHTRTQAAFLALPFVGSTHATGQILGVGIALSPDLPPAVRRSLLLLLGYDGDRPRLERLVVPGLTSPRGLTLHHPDGRRTIDPRRWTEPATVWATAYPITYPTYPHRRDDLGQLIAKGCELAGFPVPDVELLEQPAAAAAGAARLRGCDLRRRADAEYRPASHARLRFHQPVAGPVVVGHLRHLGLGLCVPEPTR